MRLLQSPAARGLPKTQEGAGRYDGSANPARKTGWFTCALLRDLRDMPIGAAQLGHCETSRHHVQVRVKPAAAITHLAGAQYPHQGFSPITGAGLPNAAWRLCASRFIVGHGSILRGRQNAGGIQGWPGMGECNVIL